jgi:glycosyltransferase involved in cell wall biosynthesis
MLTLASGIDRSRFAPLLLVLGGSDSFREVMPDGLDVERGGAKRLRDGLPWLVRRVRAIDPDVIISTMAYANFALLALKPTLPRGTRIIVREANEPEATLAAFPRFVPGRLAYRRLYPRADRILAQTDTIAATLDAFVPRARDRIRLLPNPVDVAGLRKRASTIIRKPGVGLRLVAAGRLTRQKGFDRLIGIMQKLPDIAHVEIYGEGPDRGHLQGEVDARGLRDRIVMSGYASDLPSRIAGADAFVLSSRWEGLPNAALEALALGVPVIASQESALEGVQRLAPDAVTIVPDDDAFVTAVSRLTVRNVSSLGLRDSLLPLAYEAGAVIRQFEAILTELLNER